MAFVPGALRGGRGRLRKEYCGPPPLPVEKRAPSVRTSRGFLSLCHHSSTWPVLAARCDPGAPGSQSACATRRYNARPFSAGGLTRGLCQAADMKGSSPTWGPYSGQWPSHLAAPGPRRRALSPGAAELWLGGPVGVYLTTRALTGGACSQFSLRCFAQVPG